MRKLFFPFDIIEKGSKIILYGAGTNARKLIDINDKIKWCKIICALDVNAEEISEFPVPVYKPEYVATISNFDSVVVTIFDQQIKEKATGYLINLGVSHIKIVDGSNATIERNDNYQQVSYNENKKQELKIAIKPQGGMGDYIACLKVYQEIVKLAPEAKMFVLTEHDNYPVSVFYKQENLLEIRKIDQEWNGYSEFDLVLDVMLEPVILYVNYERIERYSLSLLDAIKKLEEYQRQNHIGIHLYQYEGKILMDRAELLGLTRYSLFDISGVFGISDWHVRLNIDDAYYGRFQELGLSSKYVTYNLGANDSFLPGVGMTKLWPYEYHLEFNSLFKEKYPEIELVQIGGQNMKKVPGADRYILGESLEIAKIVLKNAICHFDCEGGLVHMASQLGTKCFVVFGPTPAWFHGYPENENILPHVCGECQGLTECSGFYCYKYDRPECMYSIKPIEVIDRIGKYLEQTMTGAGTI